MKHLSLGAKGTQAYAKKAAERMFAGAANLIFKRAAELRKRQIGAEEVLWGYLRTKPLGYKFRGQHPYLHYIPDFYCHQQKLAIEVDGPSIRKMISGKMMPFGKSTSKTTAIPFFALPIMKLNRPLRMSSAK